ncbi:MAG: hypothetical protein FWD18_08000 [Micrococcales bacterium]|nr:hypothetical protein [Micrococcales bacterium]
MNTTLPKVSPWKLFLGALIVVLLLIGLISWWIRLGVESGDWWPAPPWYGEGEEPTAWDSYEEGSAILRESARVAGLDVEISGQGYRRGECGRHDGTTGTSYTLDPLRHTGPVDSVAVTDQIIEYWQQQGVIIESIHTTPPTNPAVDPSPERVQIIGWTPLGASLIVGSGRGGTSLIGESWCSLVSGAPTPFPSRTYVPRPVERVQYINTLLGTVGEKFDFTRTDREAQRQPCDSGESGWFQVSADVWTLSAESATDEVYQDIVDSWNAPVVTSTSSHAVVHIDGTKSSLGGQIVIRRDDDGGIIMTGVTECFADPVDRAP